MRIVGVYLAAGVGRRMGIGIHKLSLPINGVPLGNIALQTALDASLETIIVVSNEVNWLLLNSQADRVQCISCPQASLGQSYSLRCGVQRANELAADAIVVILADQPFISSQLLHDVVNTYRKQPSLHYVAASYQGVVRPPVLLAKHSFPLIERLTGDEGARAIIRNPSIAGKVIACQNGRWFADIDSWGDYEGIMDE